MQILKFIKLLYTYFGIMMLLACGSRTNTQKSLTPTEEYQKYLQAITTAESCIPEAGYGCGSLNISGTAVGKSFAYKNMQVKCSTNSNSTSITLYNYVKAPATIMLGVSFYNVSELQSNVYTCIGVEYAKKNPVFELKNGYCDVSVVIHKRSFYATVDFPCFVEITKTNPLAGKVTCSQLQAAGELMNLEEGTNFTCPN